MLVDLDHLFATPIFQANRCSIAFHPLHSIYAITFYAILLFLRKPYKIIGLGLLLHMLSDSIDCLWMFHKCRSCYSENPFYILLEGFN